MKIKVVMDSGNEYYSEVDETIDDFARRMLGKGIGTNIIAMDKEQKVLINTAKVSEIILED